MPWLAASVILAESEAAAGWSLVAQALIAGGVTLTLAWMQRRTQAAVKDASDAAQRSSGAAAEKVDALAEVTERTHKLVNSEHGKALEAVALLARWKAGQRVRSGRTNWSGATSRAITPPITCRIRKGCA